MTIFIKISNLILTKTGRILSISGPKWNPFSLNSRTRFFMFAGDVGAASWSSDFSYDKYKNISLISSGMGEEDGDNFVIINVHSDKTVSYDLICLEEGTLNCFGNLTDYRLTPTQ